MATPINVQGFGTGGVNVDDEPYLLDDTQTRQSQNMTRIDLAGRGSALQTRTGLDRFNTTQLGAILGGIEAPYKGTASAPSTGGGGGGAPGDSGGTGNPSDGTGVGPGDTIGTGGSTANGGSALIPGNAGGGGGAVPNLFGGKRLILIGRDDNTQAKSGWYLTSTGFADAAYKLNSSTTSDGGSIPNLGLPGMQSNFPTVIISLGGSDLNAVGQRAYTTANGVLYYSENLVSATAASPVLPSIRKVSVDGNSDLKIVTVPDNPVVLTYKTGAVVDSHISFVCSFATAWADGNTLFFTVADKVTSGSHQGTYGRVMMLTGLDTGSYALTEIYNSLNTNAAAPTNSATQATVPYVLENFLGELWVGFYRGSAIPLLSWCMLRQDSTQPDGWGVTKNNNVVTATYGDATCMKTFNGVMYIGGQNYDPTVTAAVISSYAADGTVGVALTPTGGTILTQNYWSSLEIFNGLLYGAWYNGSNAVKIYSTSDGVTWNAVFTASSGQRVPFTLKADGSFLYAFGGAALSTPQIFLVTSNGSSWTDNSSNFTAIAPHGDFTNSSPTPILFGVDQ